ncbi:MAG TPA: hypothetical protein VGM05_08510, partial [Planctomycetaceae bacterium]
IADLVGEIMRAHENGVTVDTSAMQRQVDSIVYALYCLTDGEIQIIEDARPRPAVKTVEDRSAVPLRGGPTLPRAVAMAADENDRKDTLDRSPEQDNPQPSIGETNRNDVLAVIRELFQDGQARERHDAIRDIARELGYRRTGSTISETVSNDIRTAVRRRILDNAGGRFTLLCRSIDDYTRDDLVELFLAAIGQGWWEREEAIVAAARHLGFRRTGTNIRAAFKSVINAALRRELIEADGPSRIRKL